MEGFFEAVDKAVLDAVAALYTHNDEIVIEKSRINGVEVPWHVYSAICERIKYNANLHGDRDKSGAMSQVMLDIEGKPKVFEVTVLDSGGLKLAVQPRN